jgi:hypothetical protein
MAPEPFTRTTSRGKTQVATQRLLDEFAMAAVSGLLARRTGDNVWYEEVAEQAYDFAEAMMQERAKRLG